MNEVEVARVRDAAHRWSAAVSARDLLTLRSLMTGDIVVIHGNGRMIAGRDAVVEDVRRSLTELDVRQRVDPEETIVTGEWAFDRSSVHTSVTPRAGGASRQFVSRTITILRRDDHGTWRVARAIGVVCTGAIEGE